MGILGVNEFDCDGDVEAAPLEEILNALCDYAYQNGLIENDSVVYRDQILHNEQDSMIPYFHL